MSSINFCVVPYYDAAGTKMYVKNLTNASSYFNAICKVFMINKQVKMTFTTFAVFTLFKTACCISNTFTVPCYYRI